MKILLILIVLLSVISWRPISAQKPTDHDTLIFTQQRAVVDSVLKVLEREYVFPGKVPAISSYIRKQVSAYAQIKDGPIFSQRLSADLQKASGDAHLNVWYSADRLPPAGPARELFRIPEEEKPELTKMLSRINYNIRKVEVLKGNIGYIDFASLESPEFAGDVYVAMMNYLAHTESLIIDLRNCGGSKSPEFNSFFCSYFFEEPVHLNDMYFRKNNVLIQSWTSSHVQGPKYLDKPIYVLTSRQTFSGAEELAYNLQALKRAVIIGQPTGGGANPGGIIRLSDHFSMYLPIAQSVNPITHSNWEGSGVQPDTLTHTKMALYQAQQLAMLHSIRTTPDQIWRDALSQWILEIEKPRLVPVSFELNGYRDAREVYVAGTFNDWSDKTDRLEYKAGKWTITTWSEPGRIRYKFIVDGKWITDPGNPEREGHDDAIDSVREVK